MTFLTRTAVLERLSGPLCDAVLGTGGSGRVLERLEDSNLLLVPLDRRREWYRYHHLFGELLLAELERREPKLIPQLHVRAARWCEANGLPEAAIDHAQAAGDADRVARLVATLGRPTYAAGRVDTVRRWLAWLEERGLVDRYPQVAVLGAWVQALVGRPEERCGGPTPPNARSRRLRRSPELIRLRMAARWRATRRCCGRCCAATAPTACGPTPRTPSRA